VLNSCDCVYTRGVHVTDVGGNMHAPGRYLIAGGRSVLSLLAAAPQCRTFADHRLCWLMIPPLLMLVHHPARVQLPRERRQQWKLSMQCPAANL
jgi:hypothetical protein